MKKTTIRKPDQQMNKSTKQKQNKERAIDDRNYVREEMAEYKSHNNK